MSYSFGVVAATKAEVNEKVTAELVKIVGVQPEHAVEKQAVQAAAQALVNVLTDPTEGEVVVVSMSGSLSWRAADVYTQASVAISVGITLAPKE